MERLEKMLPLSLLSLLAGKALFVGTSMAEMGMLLGLVVLQSLNAYLDKNKKLQEIQKIVNEQNKVIEKMAAEIVTVKENVSTIKLQNTMRKL
jgi:hypothetical protein